MDTLTESESTHRISEEILSLHGRVGPYKILERLGHGGMGVVYLAEQEQPFRRRVALKVIKFGMDSREVVARFEAERQALALMDHPCISQVFDAGVTPDGRPYFAMEYVAGIPLTEYCDKHRLAMASRLELFVKVCSAIQHAHQKGVIHRDIKPSNLLVTVQDGHPVPKVIDFGVAKAIHHRLTEKTLFTHQGALIGTPAYMSPEQAEMSGLAVDTTTDIYSLGVVLYELLVGALPFDPALLRDAAYSEIQRIVREVEPLRPSTRLSGLQLRASEVALQRQTALSTLLRELKGDLDWITLKAMDKDRTRRYASASELASDVVRHLKAEQVLARPPSLRYRTGKVIRKYRLALISVALAVAVSAIISTVAQTQTAMGLVAQQSLQEANLLSNTLFYTMQSAVRNNSNISWDTALSTDRGVRSIVESGIVARFVSAVAICDVDEHVVVGSDPSMKDCPKGRTDWAALRSIGVITVLRGAIPDYTVLRPLLLEGRAAGSIRVVLSGQLMADSFRTTLFVAAVSCLMQFVLVAVVATGASLLVLRRN